MSFFTKVNPHRIDIDIDGQTIKLSDIFTHVRIDDLAPKEDTKLYRFIQIDENERPDTVSFRLYGTDKYYWLFFFINDHLREGFNRWPRERFEMNNRITKTWSKYANITFVPGIEEGNDINPFHYNLAFSFPFSTAPYPVRLAGAGEFEPNVFTFTFPIVFGPGQRSSDGITNVIKNDDMRFQLFVEKHKNLPMSFFESEFYSFFLDEISNQSVKELEIYEEWLKTDVLTWIYTQGFENSDFTPAINPEQVSTIISAVSQIRLYPFIVFKDAKNAKTDWSIPIRKIDPYDSFPEQFKYDSTRDGLLGNKRSYAEVEADINEDNKQLKVINPTIVQEVVRRIKDLYNENRI